MLEAVPDRPELVARLLIGDDSFTIISTAGAVEVKYRDTRTEPDLVVRTDYEGFLDAGEGRIPFDEFVSRHVLASQIKQRALTVKRAVADQYDP